MVQTFKDDLLEEGVRNALYKDPKDSEVDYRVLDIQIDQTGQCFALTTPFKGFRKRELSLCMNDERYFVKSCR